MKGEAIIWQINGIELVIKHPYKLYWPEDQIHKIDLLNYYREIADVMLPYFKDRPVTLHCFPRGIHDFSFYRRDFIPHPSQPFRLEIYNEISQNKQIHIPLIDSSAGLLWMANKGCIEFHLWASKIKHINYPDMLIFDLDIHKNTPFKNALQLALILKRELKKIGLRSFPKTSGCTGIHIYVPVLPENTFENIRKWIHIFIKQLEKKYPDLISAVGKDKKTHKRGKVTVDIMQNVVSRNTAAPYTARAYPGASVSAPLTWEEMEDGGFVPADFNIKNMPRRIKNKGDVFSEVLTLKQRLPL